MPRLTATQWEDARSEYEAGASQNYVAEKFGCSRAAVQKRIQRDGWVQDIEASIQRKVSEKVAGMVAGCHQQEKAEAIDAEATKRAGIIDRHRTEWEVLEQVRKATLLIAKKAHDGDEKWPVAKCAAETIGTQVRALETKQVAERKAWGLDNANDQIEQVRPVIYLPDNQRLYAEAEDQ